MTKRIDAIAALVEEHDGGARLVDISYLLGCEETWTLRIYPWDLDLGVPW